MIVSVISPCRNEASHIDAFVEAVLSQECPSFELEIVIADGRSDDGTRSKLDEWSRQEPRLRVISNPLQIVSTGLNLALREARGDIIVRMDVHTVYATDYVTECVKALSDTGATCVGGPWVARGDTPVQRAIATAFQSRIGSGSALSRRTDYSGWADTVYLGAWRRSDLLKLGGFDENLVRNQDDELCLRILRQGGRIWQSSKIRSTYIPRSSFAAVYRQFSQYGYWKIPVIRKHRLPASPRHMAPFAFLLVLLSLAALIPISSLFALALLGLLVFYFAAVWLGTRGANLDDSTIQMRLMSVAAAALMHLGYAVGFGRAIWDIVIRRKRGRKAMSQLTR